ncbi:MAG TPA: hypothetical protein VJ739_18460 [Gemmataceae bacterium]|nr:hypothetical protein [Gemmataceae bacterium]
MGLSTTNTTCDIYRFGGAPPGAPAVSGVPIYLSEDFVTAHAAAVAANGTALRWTHVALLPPTTDVRDGYTPGSSTGLEANPSQVDTLYVPDQNGVAYKVIFVARAGRGTPGDCKKAYLQRQAPTWPSNDV